MKHISRKRSGAGCLVLAVLATTQATVTAETRYWSNTAGGSYNNPDNWSPNGVPGAGDDVVLDLIFHPYTVTVSRFADNINANSLTFDHGGPITLDLNGKTLSINNGVSHGFSWYAQQYNLFYNYSATIRNGSLITDWIGMGSASVTFNLEHNNTTIRDHNAISGELVQTGGTTSFQDVAMVENYLSTAFAAYKLQSNGKVNVQRDLHIGYAYSGAFQQISGDVATGSSYAITLGQSASGTGTYELRSGTVSTGGFYIGGHANSGSGGTGKLTMTGGTLTTPSFQIFDKGSAAVSGGNVFAQGSVGVSGKLDVSGSANVQVNSTLSLLSTPNSSLSVSGGTLKAGSLNVSTAKTFNLTGGNITIDGGTFTPKLDLLTYQIGPSKFGVSNSYAISGPAGAATGPSLTLQAGADSISAANAIIVGHSGGRGNLRVTGSGSTFVSTTANSSLYVGAFSAELAGSNYAGNGTLAASIGGQVTGFGTIYVGGFGGKGLATIDGVGSKIASTGPLNVGWDRARAWNATNYADYGGGDGTLALTSGGKATSTGVRIGGNGARGTVTVQGAGSSLDGANGGVIVGTGRSVFWNGSQFVDSGPGSGSLIVSGGGEARGNFIEIGSHGATGSATVDGAGSKVTGTANYLFVGNSRGYYWNGSQYVDLGPGEGGSLAVKRGGNVSTVGSAYIGWVGGKGRASIDGAGSRFDVGWLNVGDNRFSLPNLPTVASEGSLSITNGAEVNSPGYVHVGVSGGKGELTISGVGSKLTTGSLEISGGSGAYAGAGGKVTITNGASLQTGGISILDADVSELILAGGSIQTGFIGLNTPSRFNWTSGKVTLSQQSVVFANPADGGGPFGTSLTLDESKSLELTHPNSYEWLRAGGSSITQTGGTHSTPNMHIGRHIGTSAARYTLSGGALTTSTQISIGYLGAAVFDHIGGTHTTGTMLVGNGSSELGTYNLSNTGILQAGNINVGSYGNGVLNIQGGLATISGALNGPGSVNLSGGTLAVKSLDNSANPSRFNWTGGHLEFTGGSSPAYSLTVPSAGKLSGFGTVTGNVTNNGLLAIDSAAGQLNINGEFTQSATGTLNLSFTGATRGSGYSFLSGTGTASLGGALQLSLGNNFIPEAGQSFDILDFPVISGSFSSLPLFDGLGWDISQLNSTGVITLRSDDAAGGSVPFTWKGGSGNWSDATRWVGGSAPGPGNNAYLTGGISKTVNMDSTYAAALHDLRVDGAAGALATVAQSSAASHMRAHNFLVGIDGQGRYLQTHGNVTVDTSIAADSFVGLGLNAGSHGIYDMSGGNLSITSGRFTGGLEVGVFGSGTFNMNGGTANINAVVSVAVAGGSSGVVNHTAGNITVGNATAGYGMMVGREAGASGTYNLSGTGSLTVNGNVLYVGYLGNGTFNQTGGSVTVTSPNGNGGYVYIAPTAGSTGIYTLANGTLDSRGVMVGGSTSNAGGTGIFTVDAGGVATGALAVWDGGTVNLNAGGIINAGTDPVSDNILNNGVINLNGGTLNLGGRIYSTTGSGVINTPSGTVTLADGTNFQNGEVIFSGVTVSATGKTLFGASTTGGAGDAKVVFSSGEATFGTVGNGNDGSVGTGQGNGEVIIQGDAKVYADTWTNGSGAGGQGSMDITDDAEVTIGGGLTSNSVTVSGNGKLTVLDQDPPAGEDPILDRAIVGGYLRDGDLSITGGTIDSPKIKLGITLGKIGTFTQTGGDVSVGIFSAGNNADLASGQGTGHASISGGTFYADTILLGSSNGGSGDLTISGDAEVTVGGGLTSNALIVNGGFITVLDQDPPPGEDPVLDRAIVAGYVHDGAITLNAGTITSPNMKIGVTPGKVGTYQQSNGILFTDNFVADKGVGSIVEFTGGILNTGHTEIDTGEAFVVGDGSGASATLSLTSGTHNFDNGLMLSTDATLAGTGQILNDVTSAGIIAPGHSAGTLLIDGDLILESSASFSFELGLTSDLIEITGALIDSGTGSYDFNFEDAGGIQTGIYTLMTFGSTSGITLSDFTYSSSLPIFSGEFILTETSLQFAAVVPEPSSMMMLPFLGAPLLRRRRRKLIRANR